MNNQDESPLLREDGKLHEFTINLNGKNFKCSCLCNVFHKPNKNNLNFYRCNCCGAEYVSE